MTDPCILQPTVYTLANRLFLPEGEVKQAEAQLEAERRANETAVAMYRARRVRVLFWGMLCYGGVVVLFLLLGVGVLCLCGCDG